ncbi:hypothetical protein G7Y89_g10994 [Cudoniella acicularis]|uniref:Peptidase M20 dimerisation domain-containing protein n=1 Tax=Cudoniella acicularis TaxID=354080 RepID=A0A8H4RED0_9HELO|nr:hypothetical protein G7Y89_g10994 [Cudoniella acicularis]
MSHVSGKLAYDQVPNSREVSEFPTHSPTSISCPHFASQILHITHPNALLKKQSPPTIAPKSQPKMSRNSSKAKISVVPVTSDTLPQWNHPPFSGHFDGTYIHGRGSHDCKNNVIAILSRTTSLLSAGFRPLRTVVLGFGFDEESPKGIGAKQIALHLEKVWGNDSFAIILDEGLIGINHMYGKTFGVPQASEKGYVDAVIRVHVPGGHSSMALPHTSIGIFSKAVTLLEDAARTNFSSRYTSNNPFYYQLHCVAENPHTEMSSALRKAALNPTKMGEKEVVSLLSDFASDVLLRAGQVVTIFRSGGKANALSQFAEVLVNYRISNEDSVSSVKTQ